MFSLAIPKFHDRNPMLFFKEGVEIPLYFFIYFDEEENKNTVEKTNKVRLKLILKITIDRL